MRQWVSVIVLIVMIVFATHSRAQCSSGWLPGGGIPYVNGVVRTIVTLPSGDVVVGGDFTIAGDLAVKAIARYNRTTGVFSTLGVGLSPWNTEPIFVSAMVLLPDGDLIVGGSFRRAGSLALNGLARFNPATGNWTSVGVASDVNALAILPGGDLLVGSDCNGGGCALVRYNLVTGARSTPAGTDVQNIRAMAVLPNGDVILGGDFYWIANQVVRDVARYNPTTGEFSALGSGLAGGNVNALAILPDGDLIVGGNFYVSGVEGTNNIARYNPTTGIWSALGNGVSQGYVYSLATLPEGDLLVGGNFVVGTPSGFGTARIARYNSSSNSWFALSGTWPSGPNSVSGTVNAISVTLDGKVFLGGDSYFSVTMLVSNIACYDLNSGAWSALVPESPAPAGTINALATMEDGDIVASGVFSVGQESLTRIARYDPTSATWSPLANADTNGSISALKVLPGGDVIVGGTLTNAGGLATAGIARYNSASGVWSALGAGLTRGSLLASVYAISLLPDGDLIVGGDFTHAGGVPANNIARYNLTSGVWSALGEGVTNPGTTVSVRALAVLPGGDVIAGGFFSTAGGAAANYVARYNPTTGVWSAMGSGTNRGIWALEVLQSGDLVAGGNFSIAGGVTSNYVARYNPTTGEWSALGAGLTRTVGSEREVYALEVLPGGDLMVGGTFTSAVGVVATNNIARYSPNSDSWFAVGTGVSSYVRALASLGGGDVIAGGAFITAGGNISAYFARYTFGAAPSILSQPSSQAKCPAATAVFSITALGADPFTYQWRKGTVAIDTSANPSAATASLVLTNVQSSDAAAYDCVVSNACGTVISDAALLTVCAADFNCDDAVDLFDYLDFVAAFAEGSAAADFNGDSVVDFFDYLDFVETFSTGC